MSHLSRKKSDLWYHLKKRRAFYASVDMHEPSFNYVLPLIKWTVHSRIENIEL